MTRLYQTKSDQSLSNRNRRDLLEHVGPKTMHPTFTTLRLTRWLPLRLSDHCTQVGDREQRILLSLQVRFEAANFGFTSFDWLNKDDKVRTTRVLL